MKETASSVSFLTRLNMRKILLSELKTVASNRAEGYYDACIAAGKVTGEFLYLSVKDFADLRAKYPPIKPEARPCCKGLGDAVAIVAQPIARMIDKVAGTDIQHCGGCQRRRNKLNEMFPL
jgi:hypothetical protein